MLLNRYFKITALVLAPLLAFGGGFLLYEMYESREHSEVVACVARFVQFEIALHQCLGDGKAPVSNERTRRAGELDVVKALGDYLREGVYLECPAFRRKHPGEVAQGSYRMPDWTREQWQKAYEFRMRLSPGKAGETCDAPAVWDARPVHGGRRNVLFIRGQYSLGVSEDEFQKLRRASEEFVRAPAKAPGADNDTRGR